MQAPPKVVKAKKRGKKQVDEEEKAEKVDHLQRYQKAQVAAYADTCATPTGPSVNSVQGMDKPAANAASNSRKGPKPFTKPADKAAGDIGSSDRMEVDVPPVLSGTKRTRANLSIDISTQVGSLLRQTLISITDSDTDTKRVPLTGS